MSSFRRMKTGQKILICMSLLMAIQVWMASGTCVIGEKTAINSDGSQSGQANEILCTSIAAFQSMAASEKEAAASGEKGDPIKSSYSSLTPKDEQFKRLFYDEFMDQSKAETDSNDGGLTSGNKSYKRGMNFGGGDDDDKGHKFMRFGRGELGHKFMRLGRKDGGGGGDNRMSHKFMRLGRNDGGGGDGMSHKFMRFGRDSARTLKPLRLGGGQQSPVYESSPNSIAGSSSSEDLDSSLEGKRTIIPVFLRKVKDNMKHNFMRFGKRDKPLRSEPNFLRYDRFPEHTFMRFGRR